MRHLSFCIAILLFLFPVQGNSQVINIESSRIQSDTTGWQGSAGASFASIKNTQEIMLMNIEAHLQYKSQKGLWLFLADYGFLKGGPNKYISNSFAHIRYNHKVTKSLRWEVFSQVQSNLITFIRSRFLLGTGPRFKILSEEKFRLYAASLIMYEHETEVEGLKDVVHNDIRSSSYISFTFLPSPNIELINTTFFQPRLNQFSDNRIYNQANLRVKASKRFSLNIRYNYLHDKAPAKFAPKTTYNFSSGFEISF